MTPILLSGPASEPVTVADAKAWLRLDISDDDAMLSALIVAARLQVENATRRFLIAQSWRLVLDAWPRSDWLALTLEPLRTIVAARVYDGAGAAILLSADDATFDARAFAPRLVFPKPPPAPGRAVAGIEIDVVVGYGATAADVPEPLRRAMLMLVARWYERRGDETKDEGAPAAIAALIAPYRRARLT